MGYRLFVESEDKTLNFYGTKFYGYLFNYAEDGKIYPSVRYLFELGKLEDDDFFDYGTGIEFTLTAEQFREFITLYAIDNLKHGLFKRDIFQDEEIRALYDDEGDKILSWF